MVPTIVISGMLSLIFLGISMTTDDEKTSGAFGLLACMLLIPITTVAVAIHIGWDEATIYAIALGATACISILLAGQVKTGWLSLLLFLIGFCLTFTVMALATKGNSPNHPPTIGYIVK